MKGVITNAMLKAIDEYFPFTVEYDSDVSVSAILNQRERPWLFTPDHSRGLSLLTRYLKKKQSASLRW